MHKKRHDLIIGVFVLVAIATVGFLIVKFGGARKHGKQYKLTVLFSKVSGLIEDAPVHYAGVERGSVDEIIPPTETLPKVRVVLLIYEDTTIRKDDTITISSVNLLGDKIVKIIPGDVSAPPVSPGSTVEGEPPLDFSDVITPGLQEDVREIISGLADLVSERNRELFSKTMRILYLASEGLVADLGNLREVLSEDTLISVKRIISNIDDASNNLPALTEQLTAFVDKNTSDVERLVISLRKSSDDISRFISSLRNLMQAISKGEGTIGKLVHSSELYDSASELIEAIRFYGLLGFQEKLHEKELEKRKGKEIWER